MMTEEVQKRCSNVVLFGLRAARVLCVKTKDGTLRLCVNWRKLDSLLGLDSGGLGDIDSLLNGLRGKDHFTQLDLASGYMNITIVENDRRNTAFCDLNGSLFEFGRVGFGLSSPTRRIHAHC